MKPLCIDGFCGLGGWAEGFLAEGYDVVGFDIERHDYGNGSYPGQLVLQDWLTLDGRQFRNAACIVASPPCTEYSYMAMPWSRAKQIAAALRGEIIDFPDGYEGSRTLAELTALFDTCFRIQREASEAGGRYIPLVVENVKGAQPWVGTAQAHYGSFYLWGDVGSVGGAIAGHRPKFGESIRARRAIKNGGGSWLGIGSPGQVETNQNPVNGVKGIATNGSSWFGDERADPRDQLGVKLGSACDEKYRFTQLPPDGWKRPGRTIGEGFNNFPKNERGEYILPDGTTLGDGHKQGGDWFGAEAGPSISRTTGSRSVARKAASAQIAKIPEPLARHIARIYKP